MSPPGQSRRRRGPLALGRSTSYRRHQRGSGALRRVATVVALGLVAPAAVATASAAALGGFTPLAAPQRLVDTRPGEPTADGLLSGGGLRAAGSTLEIPVAGRAGVTAGSGSAVLNVTVDGPTEPGFVTVYPCDAERPTASNLNYVAGQTIAVLVMARLAGGKVCAYNSGATHLVVDVTGSFTAGALAPLAAPRRLFDSRPGQPTADGQFAGGGARPQYGLQELPVVGRVGIGGGVGAVVLTVTVDAARQPGHVTVYPCGTDRPVASNLNYAAGQTVANTVVTRVGAGGSVCLYTHGSTDLVVDISGSLAASAFTPLAAPARLLDTRSNEPTIDARFAGLGRRPARATLQLPVDGRAGVPADASSVLLNVTVLGADSGFVTVHAAGTERPLASNLNYVNGQTVANTTIARVGAGGQVCFHTSANTHLVVDVVGWFTGPPPASTAGDCPTQQIFPNFRIVAMYGNDTASVLGVLGEQSPEQAAVRLESIAAPFRKGDRPVLGAFEYIATVATASPGPTGLYRAPSTEAQVQRYLDAARAHGLYLILDIQPGRADFLPEVQRYEKFLRQPDVGLALDPEWHVGPNSLPGKVVGQVSAAEVNQVADYLAGIVAQDHLPEKLFVVHQFQVRMITDKQTLRDPAGLAVVIHMDGFGTRGEKLTTYSFTKVAPPFHNGFKLFYDEDVNMFSAAETMALDPAPELITYQ